MLALNSINQVFNMARRNGDISKERREYLQDYDLYCNRYSDPLEVTFKIMHSTRKLSTKLMAARELLSYRYPKQAMAKLEVETNGQMILAWEQCTDIQPNEVIDLPSELIEGVH